MLRTDYITRREDVVKNIKTLYAYAKSGKKEERKWAQERYSLGKWVVVEKIDDQLYFAPSEFVGYKNNTLKKHKANKGDGRDTNKQLDRKQKIYKPERENGSLLVQYERFLSLLGFPKKYRKDLKFYIPRELEVSDLLTSVGLFDEKDNTTSYEKYIQLLKSNRNLILTGAPGTGKTYLAKAIAKAMEAKVGFVQFHPSYDYTDFVEGLRPTKPDKNGNIGFERKDGVFKEFCKKALGASQNRIPSTLNHGKSFEEAYRNLMQDIKTGKAELYSDFRIHRKLQVRIESFKGSPRIEFLKGEDFQNAQIEYLKKLYDHYVSLGMYDIRNERFHDFVDVIGNTLDYSLYRGVVQGLLDRTEKKTENVASQRETQVDTLQVDGQQKPYVFIIDEINRGEISKIFGELFFSIDPGYRGENGRVTTQYQNLIQNESDPFYKGFYVPENVYIIGTMNDIDRGVESMDFAMRRRFAWQEIKAEENIEMLDVFGGMKTEIQQKMQRLNVEIECIEGLGSAYHIGGAYFCQLKHYLNQEQTNKIEAYAHLWEKHLCGVLFEYLRGMPDSLEKLERLKKAYFEENEDNQSER